MTDISTAYLSIVSTNFSQWVRSILSGDQRPDRGGGRNLQSCLEAVKPRGLSPGI